MGNIRLTVATVAYLTTLGTDCTSGPVGEVNEVGPGTYTIGVSRALGGGLLAGDEALKATVDKAGEHCHAKGQKLSNARARSRNDFSKRALARSIWMPDCSEPRSPAAVLAALEKAGVEVHQRHAAWGCNDPVTIPA
jgi:hypothetical protein